MQNENENEKTLPASASLPPNDKNAKKKEYLEVLLDMFKYTKTQEFMQRKLFLEERMSEDSMGYRDLLGDLVFTSDDSRSKILENILKKFQHTNRNPNLGLIESHLRAYNLISRFTSIVVCEKSTEVFADMQQLILAQIARVNKDMEKQKEPNDKHEPAENTQSTVAEITRVEKKVASNSKKTHNQKSTIAKDKDVAQSKVSDHTANNLKRGGIFNTPENQGSGYPKIDNASSYENRETTLYRIRWEVAAVTILGCLPTAIGTAMIYAPYLFLPYVVPPLISVGLIVVGALCLSYALCLSLALCCDEDKLVVNRRHRNTTPGVPQESDDSKYIHQPTLAV